MRTTEEYAAMIPAAPPFDLVGYLREKGKMQTEVISYKWHLAFLRIATRL